LNIVFKREKHQAHDLSDLSAWPAMGPLQLYKDFVREHSALVVNLERLAHWVVWNPERFNGSEFAYEAFNAAVGLLGLYNESIIAGEQVPADQTDWGFLLAAVEQVRVQWRVGCFPGPRRARPGGGRRACRSAARPARR
jgi:hypothetical protein